MIKFMNLFISSCLVFFIVLTCQSQNIKLITATTEEGKKVILKSDGTWEYELDKSKSNDAQENYITAKKLEVPFLGDNDKIPEITNLVASLKNKTEKSEFETEKEYRIRIKQLMAETKLSNKSLNDYVFVASPSSFYNAESKVFDSAVILVGYQGYAVYLTKRICPYGMGSYIYDTSSFSLKFEMPPELAKMKKENLRIAVRGFPVTADLKYGRKRLDFIPTKLIVFDKITGEVYSEKSDETFQLFCETKY